MAGHWVWLRDDSEVVDTSTQLRVGWWVGAEAPEVPDRLAELGFLDPEGERYRLALQRLLSNLLPHVQTGKLRILGVTTEKRHPDFPGAPTMAEAGFPGFES